MPLELILPLQFSSDGSIPFALQRVAEMFDEACAKSSFCVEIRGMNKVKGEEGGISAGNKNTGLVRSRLRNQSFAPQAPPAFAPQAQQEGSQRQKRTRGRPLPLVRV
jgi:hypothetical protein